MRFPKNPFILNLIFASNHVFTNPISKKYLKIDINNILISYKKCKKLNNFIYVKFSKNKQRYFSKIEK